MDHLLARGVHLHTGGLHRLAPRGHAESSTVLQVTQALLDGEGGEVGAEGLRRLSRSEGRPLRALGRGPRSRFPRRPGLRRRRLPGFIGCRQPGARQPVDDQEGPVQRHQSPGLTNRGRPDVDVHQYFDAADGDLERLVRIELPYDLGDTSALAKTSRRSASRCPAPQPIGA